VTLRSSGVDRIRRDPDEPTEERAAEARAVLVDIRPPYPLY